jgi:hypothetical protein
MNRQEERFAQIKKDQKENQIDTQVHTENQIAILEFFEGGNKIENPVVGVYLRLKQLSVVCEISSLHGKFNQIKISHFPSPSMSKSNKYKRMILVKSHNKVRYA